MSRIFNIAPGQWPRVMECWLVLFFFKIGAALGFTVITAAFVSSFGIAYLPLFFVINALLTIFSTLFFEHFVGRVKKEVLMIFMASVAAILLFTASLYYQQNIYLFFALVIVADAFFLGQFNVFMPLFVGDRFTPLESQKTFSFVESSDTIGMMLGATFVGVFAARYPVQWFLYVWIAFLAGLIFTIVLESIFMRGLPSLPFRKNRDNLGSGENQLTMVLSTIHRMPFFKGLIVIVLFQWIFMNIMEFQFTKAMEQRVRNAPEQTIALEQHGSLAHSAPSWFQAAILASPEGIKNLPESQSRPRALTESEQTALTVLLGKLRGLFHFGALIVQILFASRLISGLGIIGSLLIHPVIMLMSLTGMFLKFGFTSALITRMNFEITNVIHKNSYLASHYAFPKGIREQAAEFLEGIVRPMGTLVGMLVLLGFEFLFMGKDLSMWIHIVMALLMIFILMATVKLQAAYTSASRGQLFSTIPYPEKMTALEILQQRGHRAADKIIREKLRSGIDTESHELNKRLILALSRTRRLDALPEILQSLFHPNEEIRLSAAQGLLYYREIGSEFYSHSFSRYRILESLKAAFEQEASPLVRSAIIRVFSVIRKTGMVDYLLKILETGTDETKADCLYTFGLFNDPNAAYYILPYIDHGNPYVEANAICSLWQFEHHRRDSEERMYALLKSPDENRILAGLFAVAEVGLPCRKIVQQFLADPRKSVRCHAACALMKLGDVSGFPVLLPCIYESSEADFIRLKLMMNALPQAKHRLIEHALMHALGQELHACMDDGKSPSLDALRRLKRLYLLLDEHEELFVIQQAIDREQKHAPAELAPHL